MWWKQIRITSSSAIDGNNMLHARDPVAVNGLISRVNEILLFWNRYPCMNIVRVIKSRRMRWVGHVAHMGERTDIYGVWVGKPEGKRPLGRPRLDGRANMKMDPQEVGWAAWTGLNWLRIRTGGGHL
jgi:hypothetical protein